MQVILQRHYLSFLIAMYSSLSIGGMAGCAAIFLAKGTPWGAVLVMSFALLCFSAVLWAHRDMKGCLVAADAMAFQDGFLQFPAAMSLAAALRSIGEARDT